MIEVNYLKHFLTDRDVAEIAWVSTDKAENRSDDDVRKLIRFLAREGHDSPFHHPKLHIHVRCPIFVLRQLQKHRVGVDVHEVDWNEKSYRYVAEADEFYVPKTWRSTPNKQIQGSGEPLAEIAELDDTLQSAYHVASAYYEDLLLQGVAPEQARMVLPMGTMTEVRMTISLMACYRIWKLRADKTAQAETQQFANQLAEICWKIWPVSFSALTGWKGD